MNSVSFIFSLFGICFALLSISFAVLRIGDLLKGGVYKNRISVSIDYDLLLEYEEVYFEYLRVHQLIVPRKGNYTIMVEDSLLSDISSMQKEIREYKKLGDCYGTDN